MSDTLIPAAGWPNRIEESALAERMAEVIAQVRRSREAVEIVKDGVTVAKLVPVADAPSLTPRASVIGRGIGVIGLTTPGDLLDDLLTPDEIEDFYRVDELVSTKA